MGSLVLGGLCLLCVLVRVGVRGVVWCGCLWSVVWLSVFVCLRRVGCCVCWFALCGVACGRCFGWLFASFVLVLAVGPWPGAGFPSLQNRASELGSSLVQYAGLSIAGRQDRGSVFVGRASL